MPGEHLTLSLPARPENVGALRREIVAYAKDLGASEETCQAVALAVSEALTNGVVHGYADKDPGELTIEGWRDVAGNLVVLVCDEGRGMLPRTDSPGLGVGFAVMAQTADEVRVANRPQTPGTMVMLRFELDGSEMALRD